MLLNSLVWNINDSNYSLPNHVKDGMANDSGAPSVAPAPLFLYQNRNERLSDGEISIALNKARESGA